ncbi:MAG: GNAT family N-acetyltransferase [Acidobacteria bacterium]|nr:GNAT family N-acetyltransferase [Acidobacteriota bacterium]
MDIRTFTPADKSQCLALFDGNMPVFFDQAERHAFEAWLDAPQGSYFVMEHEGTVVGCGGVALENPQLASLTWTIVQAGLQRQGLGRFLVFYCLRSLPPTVTHVRLTTIPAVTGFFEKQGFHVQSSAAREVEMIKKLQVCS